MVHVGIDASNKCSYFYSLALCLFIHENNNERINDVEQFMLSNDPIIEVGRQYDSLRRSEKKVADWVLNEPSSCISLNIGQVAKQVGVSEPTVMRFCKAIGCKGFQDFKLKLAQTLGTASAPRFTSMKLDRDDNTESLKNKVFDSTIQELMQVRDRMDIACLQSAIEVLVGARRIEFFGFGASAAVARDARHKFIRLKATAVACADPHIQLISASTMTRDDVVVAISQTGRSKDLIHSVKLAREHGATIIGICPNSTPLAELCDFPLAIAAEENTDLFTPLTSRIVHLVVIDVLAAGVAMQKEPELESQLKSIKKGLRSLRVKDL